MIPYDENGFEQAVRTVLAPWLRDHVTGGTFTGFDGARIQYYKAEHPDAKAAVVMVHGFCEFFGKFHETAYDFHENGYSVYFLEQRGHGGSQRSVDEPDVVDVADFSDYVEDCMRIPWAAAWGRSSWSVTRNTSMRRCFPRRCCGCHSAGMRNGR